MRYWVTSFATLMFVACSMTVASHGQTQASGPGRALVSEGQKVATEAPVQFLIDSAASDFHEHGPHPARFRHVRIGHVVSPDAANRYMLCGEFLPLREKGKAEWTPFVTIKTSGYEQYLGAQGASFCQSPKMVWEKGRDLSSELQSRFDSLQ